MNRLVDWLEQHGIISRNRRSIRPTYRVARPRHRLLAIRGVGPDRYDASMASKIWTAAELEQMSPTERKAIFDASIVTDLDQVPPEFLARVRARVEKIIAETESTDHA